MTLFRGFARFACLGALTVGALFAPFPAGVVAARETKSESLPPEKTQMIYDTLLPKEGSGSEGRGDASRPKTTKMTAEKIAEILREKGIEFTGESGQWEFFHEGMQVFLLTDTENNRVRVMTPLARLDLLRGEPGFSEIELLQEMMRANYLATGDTRLCMNKHIIWAAYLHPLDSLTAHELWSALEQLTETARRTRGDTLRP
jgi:hypothetical protein